MRKADAIALADLPEETVGPGVPCYRGAHWVGGELPTEARSWLRPGPRLVVGSPACREASLDEVRAWAERKPWVWPGGIRYFFCDLHADAEAFVRSLVASGGVEATGPSEFELTPEGQSALFLIGGDCFDKGPANLPLLRTLQALRERSAAVEILAGNHDLRTFMGLTYAGRKETALAHLFVRMGRKTLQLFAEVHEAYVAGAGLPHPTDAEARARLFPDESWFREFPAATRGLGPESRIARELVRIREKCEDLERHCGQLGLTLGEVAATIDACRALFLKPDGEFAWLFQEMRLAHRAGSVLFVHAGVDDTVAEMIREEGVEGVNARFERAMEDDLFGLYNGPLGNCFRTKYREIDFPLTDRGVESCHRSGLYAIAHGHQAQRRGQRVVLRSGLLNFECDSSLDRNTRALLGLPNEGGAVTIFRADGTVEGISTDRPFVRVFDPAELFAAVTVLG